MNKIVFLILFMVIMSCDNERVVELPEIQNAKITEVRDVSPAYIFYDETQPDSTLLNRKNLIISTNWLFNVDKRLALRQAIPQIKFLQEKKRNAKMHKNENAKNYYTCNDTSINNLGFIDFTNVVYEERNGLKLKRDASGIEIEVSEPFSVSITTFNESQVYKTSLGNLNAVLTDSIDTDNTNRKLHLAFSRELSFQDYITFKSYIIKMTIEGLTIDTTEIVY